eukprot:1143852-Pelagomonas_calceolata.AAC.1
MDTGPEGNGQLQKKGIRAGYRGTPFYTGGPNSLLKAFTHQIFPTSTHSSEATSRGNHLSICT